VVAQTTDATPLRIGPVAVSAPLVGGVLAAVGTFLPWISADGLTTKSTKVPVKFLFDYKTTDTGGLKVGYLILALAAAAIALSVRPVSRQARRAAGLGLVIVATLFTAQLQRLLSETPGSTQSVSLLKVLGMGVYLTLIGGVLVGVGKVPGETPSKGSAR
jgi:hypothetical protein